jgi:hypothetical protein
MPQNFDPGDFLIFQLEAGFAMLRVLAVDNNDGDTAWHVAAYSDFFPDIETAEAAATEPQRLTVSNSHIALTNRAFESTQVAKIANFPLSENELAPLVEWQRRPAREVSDRSVRLMLGLR